MELRNRELHARNDDDAVYTGSRHNALEWPVHSFVHPLLNL